MLYRAKRSIGRIVRDHNGSALPLMAAALLPIMLAIGGAVDMGRAYLVKNKLQEAVDSAALAGRRAMTKEDIASAQKDVDAFMAFNFPEGILETGKVKVTLTKPEVGTVRVAATTEMPTTIMFIMGIKTIPISVYGEAKQNFDNVDIVLVLDTTGSMAGSKLTALKEAVRQLYAELEESQAELRNQGLRMRFGIVPYSVTVNVGKILWNKNRKYVQTRNLRYYHWKATKNGNDVKWDFGRQTYDLYNYVNGGTLGNINGNGSNSGSTWAGCIEERRTTPSITKDDPRSGPPREAFDLDIDMIPDGSDDQAWKPYVFDPLNGNPNQYCPSEVSPLSDMSASDIEDALGKLVAQGNTYHDIGMIWGTRLISNGGIFGPENPPEYKQRNVQKYIIYMTDGQMMTPRDSCGRSIFGYCLKSTADHSAAYSAWGIEAFDQRIGATSDADNNDRHTKRFLMACNEAKARKVSIWTIAFGTGKVDSLDKCASNPDQSSVANNSDELIKKFAEIGRNIGPLRISK